MSKPQMPQARFLSCKLGTRNTIPRWIQRVGCLLVAIYFAACADMLLNAVLDTMTYTPPPEAYCVSRPIVFGLMSAHDCIVSTAISLDDSPVNVPVFHTPVSPPASTFNPVLRLLLACVIVLGVYRLGVLAFRKEFVTVSERGRHDPTR